MSQDYTYEEMQTILDELSGEIDRKHGLAPGWAGQPLTVSYMKGYECGVEYYEPDYAKEQRNQKEIIMRGWH